MPISAGTRLGPDEIVSRLGAGGMGELFKARDTRIERSVAIKILPAEFAENAQFKIRFERLAGDAEEVIGASAAGLSGTRCRYHLDSAGGNVSGALRDRRAHRRGRYG